MTAARRPVATGRTDTLGRAVKVSDSVADNQPTAPPPPADTDPAPLERWKGVSVYHGDIRSCDHCGTGIANVVVIEHVDTGEVKRIGTTCAERVGLNRDELRRLNNERRQREWDELAAAEAAERRRVEADQVRRFGEHGTQTRYDSGCRCNECSRFAEHGTVERFEATRCGCQTCRDVIRNCPPYTEVVEPLLVDATTGRHVRNARLVSGRYGMSWVISNPPVDDDDDDGWGGSMSNPPRWVSANPKRRSTMVGKGFVEVDCRYIGIRGRNGVFPIVRDETPTVDSWGEPVTVTFDDDYTDSDSGEQ